MSATIQTRLKQVARECGGNRAICEKSGVSERTFANWLAGTSEPKIIGMAAIARSAGVTLDWIVTGCEPKSRLGVHEGADQDVVKVAQIAGQLSDASGTIRERLLVEGHVPFSKSFLSDKFGPHALEHLCVFSMAGDSMTPTMSEKDFILVDCDQTALNDGLFVYVYNDSIFVKRLHTVVGGIQVLSDNPSYPTQFIAASDLIHFQVVGQVLWVGKVL